MVYNNKITSLYADGGVIGQNPSSIGGTWAWITINSFGERFHCDRGMITPTDMRVGTTVTNNQTEMLAILEGFDDLPNNWVGTVFSDSQITIGRLFRGWKWTNLPHWMLEKFLEHRKRFMYWNNIEHVLLASHPTKIQLRNGIGKNGHPVSIHNVWCDKECGRVGREYLESNVIQ